MSFLDKLNRFADNPVKLNMKRSKFNLSHGSKLTMNAGYLVPVMVDEILPDDTIKIDVASVIRMIPSAVPVMDNAYLDLYAFWVPSRIATVHEKDWQKVCGENVDGFWAPSSESTLQNTGNTFTLASNEAIAAQSLGDYLGLPIGYYNNNVQLSRLPFNGYFLIWNEWFRDENLSGPAAWKTWSNGTFASQINAASTLKKVAKFHDYFTSALPTPQKGNSVLLPLAGSAPVKTSTTDIDVTGLAALKFKTIANNSGVSSQYLVSNTNGVTDTKAIGSSQAAVSPIAPSNLYADLSNATAVSVNQMREAFAIQKLLEKDARSGSRFREILMAHFGVSIPDNTVQVPEYLGGKRIPLNMLQVLQTTPTSSSPLGTTGAFSNTADNSYLCTKSFSEHGYVYILACIRNNQGYSQGISKMFTRNRRYDFYYPVFANLGEMPVKTIELYADNTSSLDISQSGVVFGYQEAWAEYRFKPTKICGYLSANSGDTIAQQWTYGNKFAAAPVLNDSFIKQDRSQIDNTLVVTNSNYQFICDFFINYTSWRAMPYFSIPGLIDHH